MQATDDQGQTEDTSAIQRLIQRARRRIRGQWALEGATTSAILAAAAALAVVYLMRVEVIGHAAGIGLLVAAVAVIAAGALIKAARPIDDERIARRIDRASNLADRLSTAIAFSRTGSAAAAASTDASASDDETQQLMRAAIRDGVKAAPRADVALATPFVAPADLRPAIGFLVISALAAGLAIPTVDRTPRLFSASPDHGAGGDTITLRGVNLALGSADADAPRATGIVAIGQGKTHPAVILDWAADQIIVRIPEATPIGATTLTAWIDDRAAGPLSFTVVDPKDTAFHKADSVALDPDDRATIDALLAELHAVAKRDNVPELEDFAKQIEQLLKDAELGKISKEQLLDTLGKAEDKLKQNPEPNQAELDKQLSDMGKELANDQMTKQLGDALEKHDLEKAQKELEKLAEQLDQKQMSEQQKQELAKQLDKVAKQIEQKDKQQEQKQSQQRQKIEEEIRRLEKKQQEAQNDKDKLDAERQLDKKKDELKKLDKDEQDKQQSEQRQAVKRLTRDMQKAAENLQKPQKNQQDKDQDKDSQEQRDQQASQKLKDAARETGRVDQDQRRQATQKKIASQMDDLREAMRRAKQKGNKNGQDPFGKDGKNKDFAQRSRGQRGQSQSWKPGQGQGQAGKGQGQQQGQGQGGQGQQQGGKEWGVGHDDNLTGDPTDKSGNTKDADLQGVEGKNGGGTRETILASAQKGFASERYQQVYGKYKDVIEEVMRNEKLPASYKYYVKKYFAKIHPTGDTKGGAAEGQATEGKTP